MSLKKTINYWMPVVIILALVGATFLNLSLAKKYKMQDGFAPRYFAAKLWMKEGLSPYSDETFDATLALMNEMGVEPGRIDQGRFFDMVSYVLFYIPLSFIPYPVAKAIWMTFLELVIILSAFLSLKLAGLKLTVFESILICVSMLFFYPNLKMVLTASVLPVYIFMVIWAMYLAMNKQGTMAGVVFFVAFAMVPVSFFVALFFMIWMGARRDYSLLKVFFVGIAFLVIIGLILFPGWIADWFRSYLLLYPGFTWIDNGLMRLSELFPGASKQISIGLHVATLAYLLIEWYGLPARDQRGLQWKLALTLVLLYAVNPLLPLNYVMLLCMPLFTVYKYLNEKWRVSGRIVTWLTYLGIGVTYWINGFAQETFTASESTLLILLLPGIVFLGLQYFRWWALKSSNALIGSL